MKLQEARRRIATAHELEEIVRTMRVLARSRLVQARRLDASVIAYEAGLRGALERVLPLVAAALAPGDGGAAAVLVLGTEHGFVGGLDAALLRQGLAAAEELAAEGAPARLLLLGSRLLRLARERGVVAEVALRGPSTVGGVGAVARAIAGVVGELIDGGQADRVLLVGPSPRGALGWAPRRESLHPIEAPAATSASAGRRPLHHLPAAELGARLVRELLLARVVRGVSDAFLVEQSQRLVTLDGMRRSLDERLGVLRQRERLLRQEAITTELLDILGGAQALEEAPDRPGGGSDGRR